MTQQSESTTAKCQVQHLNPDTLSKKPAFTNVVVVSGSVKTVYVGGQDAVDASGTFIGKGDLKLQTEKILQNIQAALAAGGARLEHVIKWNIYVLQGQSLNTGFEVFQRVWGNRPNRLPSLACSWQDWHTLISWQKWMRLL